MDKYYCLKIDLNNADGDIYTYYFKSKIIPSIEDINKVIDIAINKESYEDLCCGQDAYQRINDEEFGYKELVFSLDEIIINDVNPPA